MALLLNLSSRYALTHGPALETPARGHARVKGVRFKRPLARLLTIRASADEPLPQERSCPCCAGWGRRSFMGGAAPLALISAALPDGADAEPSGSDNNSSNPLLFRPSKVSRSSRPGWYKDFYAKVMDSGMQSYEAEISRVKGNLFDVMKQEQGTGTRNVLEIGVGTGPNLKYYVGGVGVHVYGVDPNEKMEKYARKAALAAGLSSASFSFVQGVAEVLPVKDNSMDTVIGTLVMCSVNDVSVALKEVKRVLKPEGRYMFIEHVAAQDGCFLRFLQNILSPLQQLVADGCNLNRETGKNISEAGFSEVRLYNITVPNLFILGPHVYGMAQK